jgi:hypothetical protein
VERQKDWLEWHQSYDDPRSSLARRLQVVRREIQNALDRRRAGPIRVLSLCAGDGRDLAPVLAQHPRRSEASAVLIEADERLVAAARQRVAAAGLSDTVLVRQADAGSVSEFADVVPVDLLLLCGIFGNVSEEDIAATISAVPHLVSAGGFVIWTRGASVPDLRDQIRARFNAAGCREVVYEGEPAGFGVGVARVVTPSDQEPPTNRLFTFTPADTS